VLVEAFKSLSQQYCPKGMGLVRCCSCGISASVLFTHAARANTVDLRIHESPLWIAEAMLLVNSGETRGLDTNWAVSFRFLSPSFAGHCGYFVIPQQVSLNCFLHAKCPICNALPVALRFYLPFALARAFAKSFAFNFRAITPGQTQETEQNLWGSL